MINMIKKFLSFVEEINNKLRYYVNILLVLDPSSEEHIVLRLSRLFESESELSTVDVKSLKDGLPQNLDRYDLCFFLQGRDSQAKLLQGQIVDEGLACLLITDIMSSYPTTKKITDHIMFNEQQIARWALENCKVKRTSLACCFKFVRVEYCRQIIETTTIKNSALGLVKLFGVSNMPFMSLNELKMVSKIAACYGRRVNIERLAEASVTVGSAYASRGLARAVPLEPKLLRRVINASIAASTTYSLGRALVVYFESSLVDTVEEEILDMANVATTKGKCVLEQIKEKLLINLPIDKFVN
ncbi:MAG: hypothetical protein HUJ51_06885 [Eggerthellaceae bacterium]|nr:hypothetical protein [Eggerthellaceae bacterium]